MTIEEVKRIAERQFTDLGNGIEDDFIGFEFEGQYIINPWMTPCGRFDLTTDEATEMYGETNVRMFIDDIVSNYGG